MVKKLIEFGLSYLAAHPAALPAVASAVVAFCVRHFWPAEKARVEAAITALVIDTKHPMVREIALSVDRWVEAKVPQAKDDRYSAAAAMLVQAFPALRPFELVVEQVLEDMGAAAKEVAADIEAAAKPPQQG